MAKYIDLNLLTYYNNKLKTEILNKKVDKEDGKGLSTNDYTNEEKSKLAGIAEGAQVNVKPDWNASSGNAAEILNKPSSLPANGGNADTVNNHTVEANVPSNAKFTDTTYNAFVGASSSAGGSAGLVPAPGTGDYKSFLRGDGTWATIEQVQIGEAGEDFGLVKTGGNVTITDGIITVNDNGHNHTIENVTNLQETLNGKAAADHTHSLASGSDNGFMSAAGYLKLEGIEKGANKITVDSSLNESSDNPLSNKAIFTELKKYVPTSTTINGVPLTSGTITITAENLNVVSNDKVGVADGIASLDSSGKVPSSQLPSYVDDVIEGYLNEGNFYEDEGHETQITGESGKIYVDISNLKTYRWSGSAYVEITSSLTLGTTSSTAFRGDYGQIAYDHSQQSHAPANAQENVIEEIQLNGQKIEPLAKVVNIDLSSYALKTDIALATTEEIDALFV